MVTIDVIERLGLKDQYAEFIEHVTKIREAEEKTAKEREKLPPMTARQLLHKLQALDEKSLDMNIMVRPVPPSGGWSTVRDVSVLCIGHAVIHLTQPLPDIDGGTF